ncbi:Mur ligase family protein [Methanosphaera sp. WGK6]|uniref:Mur ligase family protein n=1 Tax=Methanosphaera sp. WGK6 TaxID=1561964 RepID=UPI00084CA549|nr:Mur ligase family protein [Methanosphaera sp. WGK6]
MGKFTYNLFKILPTGGKSYPGYVFLKYAGINHLSDLADDQLQNGSILITGTNGKTTTTTMIIDLLSNDTNISKSVDNNTVYALTTSLLSKKSNIGVFEYGIRDIKHGQPDKVQKYLKPNGVIYTNISREHTQVLGVKNSFNDYIKAKTLLSQEMKDGLAVVNADDPNTCYIGQNKENDLHVIYYGICTEHVKDIFVPETIQCPSCGKTLKYTHNYVNQRGIYFCDCGFSRNKPDVCLTNFKIDENNMNLSVEGNVYNYTVKKDVSFNVSFKLPLFGVYNVYNVLASITAYSCFTPLPENIEVNVENYFNSLDFTILPPGRFEIFEIPGKIIGIGQGDNGDALKVNSTFMKDIISENNFEFIYCTPDEHEEEIFEDHLNTLKQLNPSKITVVPGRVSVKAAENYFNQIKLLNTNVEFSAIDYNFEKRITGIMDLIEKSEYKYIIVTGCGEEQVVWNQIKNRLKEKY